MKVLRVVTLIALAATLTVLWVLVGLKWNARNVSVRSIQDQAPQASPVVVVSGIVAVLMHDDMTFTFLVQHPDGSVGRLVVFAGLVSMAEDVPIGHQMMVEYRCGNRLACDEHLPPQFKFASIHPSSLSIHLHSVKEILPALD